MFKGYELHKKAIESLYQDRATVIVRELKKDNDGVSKMVEKEKYINVPCRLSFGGGSSDVGLVTRYVQEDTLFIGHDVDIPVGSKIIISRHNQVYELSNIGIPKVYQSHREYQLKAFKGWA